MFHELCNPVTMMIMAPGHSLSEVQCLAAMVVLPLVLLCTLLGYCLVRPDEIRPEYRAVLLRACGVSSSGFYGILPAAAGTAGSFSRTLLHV